MAFALSPGVNVSEIDATTIVPSVGTTEAALVGNFLWGPINEIVNISNEVQLVDRFGKPDANTFESFLSASSFLSYANNLKVVRAANTSGAKNATTGNTAILITNRDSYETTYLNVNGQTNAGYGMFAAKYAGELGNSLKVSVWANNTSTTDFAVWSYGSQFNSIPNTSTYVANSGGIGDEMHIVVVDEDGKFSGTPNTILEKFSYVSKASDAKTDDGSSNYYVNVINDRSKYIYVINHAIANNSSNTTNWGLPASNASTGAGQAFTQGNVSYTYSMANGVYSQAGVTQANYQTSWDKFKNADEIDVSLLVTGNVSVTTQQYVIDNIAEFRKDCVAFVSPQRTDVVNQSGSEVSNLQTYKNTTLNRSSSYYFVDSGWKYMFDKYNNVYRWVPLNGDMAGLCVRTDFDRDPWFSPAGFNRGQIKNTVKLSWNPNKSNRDDIYKIGINPVVSFPGEGTILYGDKTGLTKPSAFDRIGVRRLFIVLEKAIAKAAKYSLFEFNDEFTRAQFVALVEPYLRDVQGRRGIYDYRVVCDTTNNTPEVIDRNEFVGDIYIKPARSINSIQLNFVAVRTGVAFEEIVGKF